MPKLIKYLDTLYNNVFFRCQTSTMPSRATLIQLSEFYEHSGPLPSQGHTYSSKHYATAGETIYKLMKHLIE